MTRELQTEQNNLCLFQDVYFCAAPPSRLAHPFWRVVPQSSPPPAAAPKPVEAVQTTAKKLSFGVGPLLPNPEDTKKAYDPFFKYLAQQLNAPSYDLAATTDWAGISVAISSGQLDLA